LISRSEVKVKIEYTSKFRMSSKTMSLLLCALTLIVSGFIILFIPNNVQTANASYVFQRMLGTKGTGNGQFEYPYGVAVDSSGSVFVVDRGNDRVQKFSSAGTFIKTWGTKGTGIGQFKGPLALSIDSSGNVFVTDTSNNRVQEFTNRGEFIRTWGTSYPYGVAVDSSGSVFVVGNLNDRIQKYTNTGGFVTSWGGPGTGPGQFIGPAYLDVTNPGTVIFKEYVYVADTLNNRIQVFTWKPDVQPATSNLNLKGSLQNNNNNTAVTSK
jgi:hypothetical protein